MAITLTWLGHATFSLDVDGTTILVDPFLAPNNPVATVSADTVSADYILITHGHADHMVDAIPVAKRTGATIIANFEIIEWMIAQGMPNTHGQHIGGGFQHPFGHVKLTPALHGSMLPDGSNGGMPNGFLLTIEGKRIYFAGDTGLFSDMQLIGAGGIDVAILPIGDNYTMGPDDARIAASFLNAEYVIPCHYDTFPLIAQNATDWALRVNEATDSKAIVLDVGGTFVID